MVDSGPGSGPGLLRYFKPCRKDSCQILLPNPTGPLSEKVDSAAIEEANKEVTAVIANTRGKHKRYLKLTDEQQATIGRYAAEHGTANVIRHFTGDVSVNCTLRLCNRESFPANNKKSVQPRKFSTANDLHYTVLYNVAIGKLKLTTI